MRKSLFWRNFTAMVLVVTVSLMTFAVVFSVMIYSYSFDEKSETIGKELDLLTESYYSVLTATTAYEGQIALKNVQYAVALIKSLSGGQVLLFDDSGKIIFCSDGFECEHVGMSLDGSIAADILSRGQTRLFGNLNGLYQETAYIFAAPIKADDDSSALGGAIISVSAGSITTLFYDLIRMMVMTLMGTLFLVYTMSYLLERRMSKPLKLMSEAAQSFAHGDFSKRIPVRGEDEISALAASFNNMAASLETIEAQRSDFIANVSHDLKTPMTTIAGYIDGILDGTIPQEKYPRYLSLVASEVRRLSRLISKLLFVSRMQYASDRLKLARVDICETLRLVLIGFEQYINERKMDVQVELEDESIFVNADPDALTQIIYNLIDNATKYGDPGGSIEITLTASDGFAVTSVKNSGQGIPLEDLPYVFDRFYKVDKSRSADREGVGLGLYIVKTTINNLGGDIRVDSEYGSYCRFTFTLPLWKKEPREPKGERARLQETAETEEETPRDGA